ncbi:MAG: PKD domain-containing protein [Phycisphaerae bacterium]
MIYVDHRIGADRSTSYDPAARTCGGGTALAYKTLGAAAEAAIAGQTVSIRAGTYREQLRPANSGVSGKRITFKNYRDEKAIITGAELVPAIDISEREHLVIEGLNVTNVRRWLYAVRSHHSVIRNNHFLKAVDPGGSSKTGLFFQEATYNRIAGNTIEDCTQDNLSLVRSDRNIVENNVFRKARHTLWAIKGGSFNILRNNLFHNEWQKIGEVYDCHNVGFNHEFSAYNCTKHNLIEGNRFAYTPSSGESSPYSGIQYAGQNGIIRNNLFHDTVGPGLSLTLYGKEANYNTDNHIYSNVFYATRFAGISLSPAANLAFARNVIKNNILAYSTFAANDTRWRWYTHELDGKPVQMLCGRTDGFFCEGNNLFSDSKHKAYLITLGSRSPLVQAQQPLTALQTRLPHLFRGNFELDPLFVDAAKRDFRLKPTSPMIDRGVFLTNATASGSGTSMSVEDVGYFCDGFDIPGEEGDLIGLEGQDGTARVVDIDYEKRVLHLSQSLRWTKGQGVALRYLGRRPDIGACEFVPGGNVPPVAAFTAAPQAPAPLSVDLDASVSDDDGAIVRHDWDLGDGTAVADGPARLSHTYTRPGTYAVTLKVTDNGRPGLTGVASLDVSVGKPVLAASATSVTFGPTDESLPLKISNSGDGTLVYRVIPSVPWLSVRPSTGTCTTETDAIVVNVHRAGLDTGVHKGAITVDASAAGVRRIAVTATVPTVGCKELINVGDDWRYLKGVVAPPGDWRSVQFDDSAWANGPSGIGYSSDRKYPTNLADMKGGYISVFMRRKFRIDDVASVVKLRLGISYDDGFVAYINGKEVARSRSMGTSQTAVRHDKDALSKHDEEEPEELFDIEPVRRLLTTGDNVLAIQFHNEWIKGTDACAVPRLEAVVAGGAASSPAVRQASGVVAVAVGAAAFAFWRRRRRRRKPAPALGGPRSDQVLAGGDGPKWWRISKWAVVGAGAAGIAALSYCPSRVIACRRWDKAAHALAYSVLAFLLLSALGRRSWAVTFLSRAFRGIARRANLVKVLAVLLLVGLFGLAIELTQPLVGRDRSLRDLAANVAGACFAAAAWWLLRRVMRRPAGRLDEADAA